MIAAHHIDIADRTALGHFRKELSSELSSILAYWQQHVTDLVYGGFYGSVSNENTPTAQAPKGIVMNSRICWAFSAGYNLTGDRTYLETAKRAADYILEQFIDVTFGGVYWSVDHKGNMLDGKKQVYGIAFCIYAFSEYYKATRDEKMLEFARQLMHTLEKYSLDPRYGGYVEAFSRDWKNAGDLRLSDKDDNARKTMNTHLHVIEGYACLYQVWPDVQLKEQIRSLLSIFHRSIIDATGHLHLFMDDEWNVQSSLQSYGHDIEAGWLLLDCARVIDDKEFIELYTKLSISITEAAIEGLDSDGSLWYEYEPTKDQLIKEKHSWPQAEAMIGFFNAWELTGSKSYLQYATDSWNFIKNHIRDDTNGEWFWGVNADYSVMQKDKAGFWKCPYHNSRACIELIERISDILK